MNFRKKIRVLIVDDSALVRQILASGLAQDPGIEVVGTASDPYMARDMILKVKPHVLTLDVEMPRMDGVDFLRKLMPQFPIPVIMVSALTEKGKRITMDALEAGAVDFVTKPSSNLQSGLNELMQELCTKIKIASTANVSHWKGRRPEPPPRPPIGSHALAESTDKVIAIGASTGGTEAIRQVLCGLPADCPGVVIVQHMPPGFTSMFAKRLNQITPLHVKEAETGDRIMPGRVLIAPGSAHLKVLRRGGIYEVNCRPGAPVCGHCPSVEVLFESVAREVAANAIGVIMTGMGRDGANALLTMRRAGAYTIGQNEESCVVYGMPKEAYTLGAVMQEVHLEQIAGQVIRGIRMIEDKGKRKR